MCPSAWCVGTQSLLTRRVNPASGLQGLKSHPTFSCSAGDGITHSCALTATCGWHGERILGPSVKESQAQEQMPVIRRQISVSLGLAWSTELSPEQPRLH